VKTVFLELLTKETPEGVRCVGRCWEDNPHDAVTLEDLRLGPLDTVAISDPKPPHKSRDYSLGQLVLALIEFRPSDLEIAFQERGQITLGQYLWQQTLGRLDRYRLARDVDLRIVTEDEDVARLPWPLLARRGVFLVAEGWTISLVSRPQGLEDIELPPLPRILMVAPQPESQDLTQRDEHISEFQRLLRVCDARAASADRFRVVFSWEDFQEAVAGDGYDIVYYYGHGTGTLNRSRLLLESREATGHVEIAVSDMADCLRAAARTPLLAYVNCCQGDAGGLLGAGWQLGVVVPCVVTNRTVAGVTPARAQAIAFWRDVLLRGVDPRLAVARNYGHPGDSASDRSAAHWFTPVLHANYGGWSANPPKRVADQRYDPHWMLKVDRTKQWGELTLKVRDMILERKPRARAFLWFGEEGQGMRHFQERLEVELHQHVDDVVVTSYRPRWPAYYANETEHRFSVRAFEEMLWEAFEVQGLDQICARVRHDATSRSAVVVLNHPHVTSLRDMDPDLLQDYLLWWDRHVVHKLEEPWHQFVLGFSFQPKNTKKFEDALSRRYDALEFEHMVLDVLLPLESIKRKDLVDFLRGHNIYIPERRKETFLDYIMQRTEGRYEATLLELEKLVIEGYAELVEAEAEAETDPEEDWGMGQD